MSLFANLTNDGLEESQDRLGGNFSAIDTDIYTGTIKAFYAGKSEGGANNVTVILAGGDYGDREYRETVYITNKKGENFFLNKNDQTKKVPLPGFTTIDDICQVTVGTGINAVNFEDKVINVWDPEQRKELPKTVKMAVDLIGKEVSLGITKTVENQTEKNGQGDYVPKADGSTREVNAIDKVFHTQTKMTVAEARGGATEPQFWDKWSERNKGQVRDKTVKDGPSNGRPGGGAPQAGNNSSGGAPRSSLFGTS